jgi:hypothetical protein
MKERFYHRKIKGWWFTKAKIVAISLLKVPQVMLFWDSMEEMVEKYLEKCF